MTPKPENLTERIQWTLAVMAISEDADFETKQTHKVLREKFNMNPDIRKRGDAI